MTLQLHAIFRTNYGTGPYQVTELWGPCTCGFDDKRPGQSEAHYHIDSRPVDGKGKGCLLAGYRLDGSNVWTKAQLTFEGLAPAAAPAPEVPAGTNLSLF